MTTIDNSDNPDDFLNSKKNKRKSLPLNRNNLSMPTHIETLDELIAEGNRLLDIEEKARAKVKAIIPKVVAKDESKKLERELALKSTNPYVKARAQILNEMSKESQETIEKMENGTFSKDSRYDDFTKRVSRLGDTLSGS